MLTDLVPCLEVKDGKTVNNPLEAYIITEVCTTSLKLPHLLLFILNFLLLLVDVDCYIQVQNFKSLQLALTSLSSYSLNEEKPHAFSFYK